MGKRFINFKVSRVFNSCRSKHPSSLPSNPVPSSFLGLPPPNPTTTTPNKPHHFSLKRHVSSALLSARRSFSTSRPSHDSSPSTTSTSSSRFRWEKQRKWHVIAKIPDNINLPYNYNYDSTPPRRKIYNSAASDDDANHNDVVLLPPPPTTTKHHHKRRRIPRRRRAAFRRNSTSSDSGLFSEDGEEIETLVSTTDSSTPRHRRRQAGRKSSAAAEAGGSDVSPSPARLSEFMRKMMPCRAEGEVVEGKVRDSFAVVKRSVDPYEDFRRSMAEMVVEKQMFDRKELEELLRCFLSLNTEHHHGAIVRAFVDIWEGLFCPSSVD